MKNLFALPVALFATPVFAHSGHLASIDGHSHTLFEFAMSGAALASIVGVAAFILVRVSQK